MCDCAKGKCPTCGAPVRVCPHCGKPEYDPPAVQPYYPYWYPYWYPTVNIPSITVSDSAEPYTITWTCNNTAGGK